MATLRQRIVATKLGENIRKGKVEPMGKILKESGYSDSVCKHPDRVTKTKGWQKLMDKYFPEEELAKKHAQLLEATKLDHFTFPNTMSDQEIEGIIDKVSGHKLINIQRNNQSAKAYFVIPDSAVQADMVKLGYKIHGILKSGIGDSDDNLANQEVREAIFRIRKILPASGN